MAHVYEKYMKLLSKWPIDPTKNKRDLGQFIRDKLKVHLDSGKVCSAEDQVRCLRTHELLNKIADNQHRIKYKRSYESSATGLTALQCKEVLSDDFLKYLKEDQVGFLSKVFKKKTGDG